MNILEVIGLLVAIWLAVLLVVYVTVFLVCFWKFARHKNFKKFFNKHSKGKDNA